MVASGRVIEQALRVKRARGLRDGSNE